jgi:hypothetical protein
VCFVHSCYCQELADPSDRFDLVLAADVWKVVSRLYDTDKSRKKCKSCQVLFNSPRSFVAQTT